MSLEPLSDNVCSVENLIEKRWPNAITTASGLKYVIVQEGSGQEFPTAGTKVCVHYTSKLLDGNMIDSSYGNQPIEFVVGMGKVIKGLDEALLTMRSGERRILIIPPSLGHSQAILPNDTIVSDVKLVSFVSRC